MRRVPEAMHWADACQLTGLLDDAVENELLSDVHPEDCVKSAEWLPHFRRVVELLDSVWNFDGEAPGASVEMELLLGQLREAAETAELHLAVLSAAFVRRLAWHLKSEDGAVEPRRARALRLLDAVLLVTPPASASAPHAAASIFDEVVKVLCLIGASVVRHEISFGDALVDIFLVATSSGAGPLLCYELFDWVLRLRSTGHRLQGAIGTALLRIAVRLLHCGHRCGWDSDAAVAHAMRASIWLATGLDTDCDDEVRHGIAVANDRHNGALLELSAKLWVEAVNIRDEHAFAEGFNVRDVHAPGGASQRRHAREANAHARQMREKDVMATRRIGIWREPLPGTVIA
jgi:hypothetical protein